MSQGRRRSRAGAAARAPRAGAGRVRIGGAAASSAAQGRGAGAALRAGRRCASKAVLPRGRRRGSIERSRRRRSGRSTPGGRARRTADRPEALPPSRLRLPGRRRAPRRRTRERRLEQRPEEKRRERRPEEHQLGERWMRAPHVAVIEQVRRRVPATRERPGEALEPVHEERERRQREDGAAPVDERRHTPPSLPCSGERGVASCRHGGEGSHAR
jgi:hypothetical protein